MDNCRIDTLDGSDTFALLIFLCVAGVVLALMLLSDIFSGTGHMESMREDEYTSRH